MKTDVFTITPDEALAMLRNNLCNRPLNKQRVKAYAEDMASGNWQLTHQGILIGKNNVLIDGQTRLNAVVHSGVAVRMMVTHDESIETPLHMILDRGNPRSLTYILGKANSLIGAANLAVELIKSENRFSKSQIGISIVGEICDQLEPAYMTLYNGSKNTAKNITTSPVVLACCMHIMSGHGKNYVVSMFNNMRTSEFTNLSPCAASFFKQVVIEKTSMERKELFLRAYKAFDVDNSNKTKLYVIQNESTLNEAVFALNKLITISHK